MGLTPYQKIVLRGLVLIMRVLTSREGARQWIREAEEMIEKG